MANFTWTPNTVTPLKPQYHIIATQTDSLKKNFQLLSTTPIEQFRLEFSVVTMDVRALIRAHYDGQYGEFSSFSWTTVPSYIKSGATQTVRYISYDESPIEKSLWRITITFEISI